MEMFSGLSGSLLVATPSMDDPNFRRAVVLVLEHGEDGTVGLVLNRRSDIDTGAYLPNWVRLVAPSDPVFIGGPVEPEVAIGLIRRPGKQVGVLSGVGLIDLSIVPSDDLSGRLRVYSGYAGWDIGQLEQELSGGAWFVVSAETEDPFDDTASLWRNVLRRQRGNLAILSAFTEEPILN